MGTERIGFQPTSNFKASIGFKLSHTIWKVIPEFRGSVFERCDTWHSVIRNTRLSTNQPLHARTLPVTACVRVRVLGVAVQLCKITHS